jgi:hypothetical protein
LHLLDDFEVFLLEVLLILHLIILQVSRVVVLTRAVSTAATRLLEVDCSRCREKLLGLIVPWFTLF